MNMVRSDDGLDEIYLDHQATTPVDERVTQAMLPFFDDVFANPHSITYRRSILASQAVEKSRKELATAVGAPASDIFFTSGATEANNLALQGIARGPSKRRKVITQATEHRSVLDTVKYLGNSGCNCVVLPVKRDGSLDLDRLRDEVDDSTLLVSVMHVNNETGVIHPVDKIAEIAHDRGALFHSDCAQAIGKVPVNVRKMSLDMASFSGHKAYGPKGIGALFANRDARSKLSPLYYGGGQERGIRPGTLPVPLCVGLGRAFVIATEERASFSNRANRQIHEIREFIESLGVSFKFNGNNEQQAPGCLSVTFPDFPADGVISSCRRLELSSGSACESTKNRASHVLKAMGMTRSLASSTLRISVGRYTDDHAICVLKDQLKTLTTLT